MPNLAGNQLFATGKQALLDGTIIWTTDTIRAVLVDHGVDHPQDTDQFLSDIASGARVGPADGQLLTGRVATTTGAADADDTTIAAVTGNTVESIVIFEWTGVDTTSRLLAYIDTATGLPITPNGGDITIVWDNGTNRIFRL